MAIFRETGAAGSTEDSVYTFPFFFHTGVKVFKELKKSYKAKGLKKTHK